MENYEKMESGSGGVDSKFDLGPDQDTGLYEWNENAMGAFGAYEKAMQAGSCNPMQTGKGSYNPMQAMYGGKGMGMFGMSNPIMELLMKQMLVMYLMQDIGMQGPMMAGGRC